MPTLSAQREAKWVISQCDWLCGTRIHSAIAALSSGVSTAAIACSAKTLGVFETCGKGAHVADPRQLSIREVIERLSLKLDYPNVLQHATDQMRAIIVHFAPGQD